MTTGCGQQNSNTRVCPEGAQYVKKVLAGPPRTAIMACEGGCIKGEVARVAANILAYQLEQDAAVRICLGDAVTAESGFVELVKQAPTTIVLEGCFLHCGTNIMKTRLPDFDPVIVEAIRLYNFDRDKYFEIFDMPRAEIEQYAKQVADYVQQAYFHGKTVEGALLAPSCNGGACCW
ncbi:MAG: hypothetical protein K0Q77_152 [Anaerosporomusa subterranea]|jgi:uncharacterized metal-binding protein|nr:hypothetical protein [Anaerosporomusa subterranea]